MALETSTVTNLLTFTDLEIPAVYAKCHVAEALVFEQETQIIGKAALGYFELYGIGLPRNVNAVGYNAHLFNQNKYMMTLRLCKSVSSVRNTHKDL